MTSGRGGYGAVARQVGRIFGGGSAVATGEDRLLARFVRDRDEAAFEALVGRHGPMVLGTCRRILVDPHDVEDAFQATFLVLARRAGSIRDADRLGPWLHGVARRVAARSRSTSARRSAIERPGGEDRAIAPADASIEAAELRAALDDELARLPQKYRAPLVLCYLEGLTHDEAARHLHWPVGTVRSRLAGGRDRLRARLTRRGLAPPSAALPIAALSPNLLTTTARLAIHPGSVPARVSALAKGAMIAMTASKLKVIAAVGLMAGLAAGGVGAIAQQSGDGPAIAKGEAQPPRAARVSDDLARLQGEWRLIDVQPAKGETFIRSTDLTWSVRGRDLVSIAGGKELDRGVLTLLRRGDETMIDLVKTRADGTETTDRGLYRFRGDTLEVCMNAPDGPRPAGFEGGTATPFPSLFTFERPTPETSADARLAPASRDPIATIKQEWEAVEAELEMTNKRMEQVKSDHRQALRPLEADLARLKLGAAVLETRWKGLVAKGEPPRARGPAEDPRAGLDAANARIKQLEGELDAARAGTARREPRPARASAADLYANRLSGQGQGAMIPVKVGGDGPGQGRLKGFDLPGGECVLVIPPEADRMTIFNTATGARSSLPAPEGVAEMGIVYGPGVGAAMFKGAKIGKIAAYDAEEGVWYPHDLREPASAMVDPNISPGAVSYQVGRHLYMFSTSAKKWGILELKQAPSADSVQRMTTVQDGKSIVVEGDVIHVYNANTGEWSHIAEEVK